MGWISASLHRGMGSIPGMGTPTFGKWIFFHFFFSFFFKVLAENLQAFWSKNVKVSIDQNGSKMSLSFGN